MDGKYKRNLMLYISGYLISMVGSQIQAIAVPLFILDRTGSGTLMGVQSALSLFAAVAALPIAGVLGDRLDRRRIMVCADFACAALVFVLSLLAFMDKLTVPVFIVLHSFVAMLTGLFSSSSAALLPDLVPEDKLTMGNAAKKGAASFSMLAGPILGAFIYGAWGIKIVLLINAISFALCGLFEFMIYYRPNITEAERLSLKTFAGENMEILKFIAGSKSLRLIVGLILTLNVLLIPIVIVVIPYTFIKIIGFSSQQLGYFQAAFMVGALLGSIVVGTLLSKLQSKVIITGGLISQACFIMLFSAGFLPPLILLLGGASWVLFGVLTSIICIIGFLNYSYLIPLDTSMQKLVEGGKRARFYSLFMVFTNLATPLGMLVYGFLLDRTDAYIIMLAACGAGFLATVVFLFLASGETFEPHSTTNKGVSPGRDCGESSSEQSHQT